ncbi:hypothetical protein BYT27DRAFT_7213263 [Phlegmacium glaucopus]|nr:hypothetical protein BYT27DRAFT_7213263 [Phlegmacium glaucopus]
MNEEEALCPIENAMENSYSPLKEGELIIFGYGTTYSSNQVNYYTLMGRLYRYDKGKPFFFKIVTQDDQQAKLEQAGGAFRENGRIYYFRVAVLEGSKCHKFQLSCKGGSALPTNQALQQIGKAWRGDIFVMCIGKCDPQDLVNMGGCDARRVDFAVKNKLWGNQKPSVNSKTEEVNTRL